MPQNQPISRLATAACAIALALAPACIHADSFTQTNLVSDIPLQAANTDPNLKNPWGVAFSATSPFWTSDQATGLATLYNAAGVPQGLVVTIPGGAAPPTGPTGMVFSNITGQFPINGTAATFIFDNLNGTISGWNGSAGTTAVVMATTPGAVYTGLAQASNGTGNFLYAANSSGGRIDVFSSSWAPTTLSGSFVDPNLPAGFVPFNIQNLGGSLYVTYAQLGPGGSPMPGGVVDQYDANGNFIKRIASNGPGGNLFAPWGIVFAPSNFGSFSNDLLIGNFGNGEILAYDATSDLFLGTINGINTQPLVNDHLWALETRAGVNGFDPSAVYFSAGINNQADGLFGKIDAITPEPATIFGTATGLIALALSRIKRPLRSNRV
ncbi:MAG TPA: TIGR03118 family protein [Edaphobacter sp.]|jgi:uncharacterized protein (TIGR03118 family)|nr:TIGR03118 family protein [Edaphobacter sp.]